ncbi:hypothetical protein PPYR_14348, partial [Photinus pyralis]
SSFTICKLNDPKLNECYSRATERALKILREPIPELSLPSIEPLKIDRVDVPADSNSINFRQTLLNIEVYNLTNSMVNRSQLTFGDDTYHMKSILYNPLVTIKGIAELDGKILVLQIKDKGPFEITLERSTGVFEMSGRIVDKGGKRYLTVERTACKLKPDNAIIKFENLFEGNRELGEIVNAALNEHWREILDELGSAYEEALAAMLKGYGQRIVNKVPFENLFAQ